MLEVLNSTGIARAPLFKVEGDLRENYNRALEKTIGKKTALTSFHIDQRGESPELEAELGKNYLQAGPSYRYCILVSPDQKDAGLIHEEFSFDHEVLDFLYQNYLTGISVATRVDGLYGEINDDVGAFETLEDLLLIKRVHLELHTPSGFLTKARELQQAVKQLQTNPELLIKDGSAVPKKILALVKEVGDVRNYNLSPIQATKELTTFFTRLFGGVCIFRNFEAQKPLQLKRPDQEQYLYSLQDDALIPIQNLPENLLEQTDPSPFPLQGTETPPFPPQGGTYSPFEGIQLRGGSDRAGFPPQGGTYSPFEGGRGMSASQADNRLTGNQTEPAERKNTPLKTVVIYQQKEYQPEDGPAVQFIPLQEKERVVRFLVENGYAAYTYALLEACLSRLEDETLLLKGHEVTTLTKEQRIQALAPYHEAMLFEWYELKDIARQVSKGHELAEIIAGYSAVAKSLLLASVAPDKDAAYVVEHLLTRLSDWNYAKMYIYNRRHLERIYEKADEKKQKYILQTLDYVKGEHDGN